MGSRHAAAVAVGTLVASMAMSLGAWSALDTRALDEAMAAARDRAALVASETARRSRAERSTYVARLVARRELVAIADVNGEVLPGSRLASVARREMLAAVVDGQRVIVIDGAPHAVVAHASAPSSAEHVVVAAARIERDPTVLVALVALTIVASIVGAWIAARAAKRRRRVLDDDLVGLDALAGGRSIARVSDTATTEEEQLLASAMARLAERVEALEEQRRAAEGARRLADRAKTAFLATVSHELRTPLQAVLGFADVLLAGIDGPLPPSHEENVRIIRKSGDYLLTLVNDVLDLSALASGSMVLGAVAVDVSAAAEEVVEISRGLVIGEPVSVRIESAPDVPLALADPTRLRQVLHNLVGNAIKHARGSDVIVEVHGASAAMVEVRVRDAGPGIAPSDLERIFEPYHRARESERTSGVGLGLTISRALVERQGGTVFAESEPGAGTTFVARWPAASTSDPGPLGTSDATGMAGGR